MRAASFVVTGEGRLDEQTLEGKAAGEVAVRCRQAGVACPVPIGHTLIQKGAERLRSFDAARQEETVSRSAS